MNKEENVILIWDKYDNKYKEVVDIEVAKVFEADLYEANNRIVDLMNIIDERDKIIDLMVDEIYRVDWQSECGNSREAIKKYFEERCNK